MAEAAHTEKRYPVKFPAPAPTVVPAPVSDGIPVGTGRKLNTYVHDWLNVREFEAMMPGWDIVQYMCYKSVGPNSWTINICPEEVLSCEREGAIQTLYVNEVFKVYVGIADSTREQVSQMARGYGEISPDAVLFLMRLHEFLHPPSDNLEEPTPLAGKTLQKAVDMMLENGINLHDLIKSPATPQ